MKNLETLIQELCPDGVEFVKLGDVCDILDSKRKPVAKGRRIKGEYPYYGANGIQDYIDGYIFDGTYLLLGEDGSVINKDNSPVLNWATGKIWVNNHAHVLAERNDIALLRYLYYVLQTCDVSSIVRGMPPKLNQENLRNIEIPLPPIEVQTEIARILDKFTSLEAELEAELDCRKRQYEYYRDKLLSFDNVGGQEVEMVKMGDYFKFKNGINKGKQYFGSGDYIVNFTDVYNNRWLVKSMLKGRVQTEPKDLTAYDARKGDIFFTRTSETKEDIGMASALVEDVEKCVFSGFVLRARPLTDNWIPKFCSYYFSTSQMRQQIVRYASFTTRALTSGPRLSKLLLPLISKEEQHRIVSILDRFESLTTSLQSGLPAEISARRQQYEYYRDKLLTFKRKGAA